MSFNKRITFHTLLEDSDADIFMCEQREYEGLFGSTKVEKQAGHEVESIGQVAREGLLLRSFCRIKEQEVKNSPFQDSVFKK